MMQRLFAVGLGVVSMFAVVACDPKGEDDDSGDAEPGDCEQHASATACLGERFAPNEDGIAHQCAWVEVYSPTNSTGECSRGEPSYQCVLALEVDDGCGPEACDDEKVRTYYKYEGDEVQVVRWSSCGGQIFGDWTKCDAGTEADSLAACRCVC